MIYYVQARLKEDRASELLRKLTDGSISGQRPDGPEIVASMERAVISKELIVEWSEMCFCPTPLLHERSTVLDYHFDDISTDPIDAHETYTGLSFMEHLRNVTARRAEASSSVS